MPKRSNASLFRKIWEFWEQRVWPGIFVMIIIATPFLFGFRSVWDTFITYNTNVPEIYWQTLTILLVILIPVTTAVIEKLEKNFTGFGAKIFFEQVAQAKHFWVLFPFSFLLFFALPGEDSANNILTFFHYILFFAWCVLFWMFFALLRKSMALFMDRGELMSEVFFEHLRVYDDEVIEGDDEERVAWKLLWTKKIDFFSQPWREKFLLLFWKRWAGLMQSEQYVLARELLEDFSAQYLALGKENEERRKASTWINTRMSWQWFTSSGASPGKRSPDAIAIRLLEFHFDVWKRMKLAPPAGAEDAWESGKFSQLMGLQGKLNKMLEELFRDEMKGSRGDAHEFAFRCLWKFFDMVEKRFNGTESIGKKYEHYLIHLPVYSPVFDAADDFSLSRYEPQGEWSGFPNRWRVLAESWQTIGDKTAGAIQRQVWLTQFLRWSRDRIDHGKTERDAALDGALSMLFPEAYSPWMAFAVAYQTLSFGANRIEGLCLWRKNFGDDTSSEHPGDGEELAAQIIQKYGGFGTRDQVATLITALESLAEKFVDDELSECNRTELLEMLRAVLGQFPAASVENPVL